MAGHTTSWVRDQPLRRVCRAVELAAHRLDKDAVESVVRQLYAHAARVESNDAAPLASAPVGFRTGVPFYSERVERKVLLMLDFVDGQTDAEMADLVRLAFAVTMVEYSNYSYEPSLSRRASVGRADVPDFLLRQQEDHGD